MTDLFYFAALRHHGVEDSSDVFYAVCASIVCLTMAILSPFLSEMHHKHVFTLLAFFLLREAVQSENGIHSIQAFSSNHKQHPSDIETFHLSSSTTTATDTTTTTTSPFISLFLAGNLRLLSQTFND